MSKIMRFEVVIPQVPDWMTVEAVQSELIRVIGHPYDAAFEADVEIHLMDETEVQS